MKIGILTLPLHANYGGILQAYALQTVLQRMGHDVSVLNKRKVPKYWLPIWKRPLVYVKRILRKIFVNHRAVIFWENLMRREYPLIHKPINDFIDGRIHSRYIVSAADIHEGDFDCFVVGSDQIWRPEYILNTLWEDFPFAFLGFAKTWNVKRYAYAASFGRDEWEFPLGATGELAELAQKFIAVSVREDSGISLCRDFLGVDAVQLLDPTMLLDKSDYLALIDAAKPQMVDSEMFCYMLDETAEKNELVEKISSERGMKPHCLKLGRGCAKAKDYEKSISLEERIFPSVEQWLRGFACAKFVLTDSFHGCVFSILFGKPFLAFGNVRRGLSRMQSLLKMFGLESHLIMSAAEYDSSKSYDQPQSVQEILKAQKVRAMEFLKNIR